MKTQTTSLTSNAEQSNLANNDSGVRKSQIMRQMTMFAHVFARCGRDLLVGASPSPSWPLAGRSRINLHYDRRSGATVPGLPGVTL